MKIAVDAMQPSSGRAPLISGEKKPTMLGLCANFLLISSRSANIYHSTFLKMAPGWALVGQPILVAVNAKKSSPLAAVTWSNGLKVRN